MVMSINSPRWKLPLSLLPLLLSLWCSVHAAEVPFVVAPITREHAPTEVLVTRGSPSKWPAQVNAAGAPLLTVATVILRAGGSDELTIVPMYAGESALEAATRFCDALWDVHDSNEATRGGVRQQGLRCGALMALS